MFNYAGIFIFLAVWVGISARRLGATGLDRPAVVLLGAVLCVGLGALGPEEALAAVDGGTLLLLLGVMGMGAFLTVDGFFEEVEKLLQGRVRSAGGLLGWVVWGAGLLGALITNDAVCVLGAPLVVRLVRRHGLPPLPFLLALATGANTGSAATLVGNPQNMLCGLLGELSYLDYVLWMGPVAALGLLINHGLLAWMFRGSLRGVALGAGEARAGGLSRPNRVTLGVICAVAVGCALGAPLAWAAAAGFSALLVWHRRESRRLWGEIDWALLLFFAGLFVVVEGLTQSGATAWLSGQAPLGSLARGPGGLWGLSGVFLLGSNLVSNVPFILVIQDQMGSLPDPRLGWSLLAMASTFAGNLTLPGSVANLIVAEAGRELGGIGFWEHLRVGLPLGLATTAAGTAWLWWLSA